MALITDPDDLAQGSEVTITTATKKIDLNIAGALSTDGVTLKCLYSFLKEEWKSDAALIKFPFPMTPITDEQFEFINGWDLADQDAENLVRTAGWAVRNTSGAVIKMFAGVVTLGSLPGTAQVYYVQDSSTSATTTNIVLQGAVNQAIQIVDDPNGDGNYTDGYDKRSYLKLFVREWQYSYAAASLTDIGVSQLSYQAYRFPLTIASDIKIADATEANANLGDYLDIDVAWVPGTTFENPATARSWTVDQVGKDTAGRWFRCSVAGSLDASGVANYTNNGGTGTFVAFEGERQIGTGYYPFSIVVDGNVDTTGVNALAETIYTRVAYLLDQAGDMDTSSTTHNGNITDPLLRFVGDTLITAQGVFIDNYRASDINRITFTDVSGGARQFPYTATLTINFGANLSSDTDAIYRVFFTNDDAGDNTGADYGTSNAILVQDASASPMSGSVPQQAGGSSVQHTFAYDANVQRGTGSVSTDAPITAVAIGLSTGQFVTATGTIQKSTANAVALVAALERNYSNPA